MPKKLRFQTTTVRFRVQIKFTFKRPERLVARGMTEANLIPNRSMITIKSSINHSHHEHWFTVHWFTSIHPSIFWKVFCFCGLSFSVCQNDFQFFFGAYTSKKCVRACLVIKVQITIYRILISQPIISHQDELDY